MRNESLLIPLLSSLVIHSLVIVIASTMALHRAKRQPDFLPINLVDLPRTEKPLPKVESLEELRKPPPKAETPKKTKPSPRVEAPAPLPAEIKEEPRKESEVKTAAPAPAPSAPSIASGAPIEGGGSEAGAGHLFGKGDVAVVPGSGTAGGGGGTAASGLGRGAGAPGLPAQQPVLRANREAKPIQTVKATYPPMALRMGMESNVTLKIEVDPEGKVTRAEIIKSGGAGFDEEALKAVRQSRFEPAQRDGKTVPAEFTYIYRFRLQR